MSTLDTPTDDDLTAWFHEAALSFDASDRAPVLEALEQKGVRPPLRQRRGARLLVAAAVVGAAVALGATVGAGGGDAPAERTAAASAPQAPAPSGPESGPRAGQPDTLVSRQGSRLDDQAPDSSTQEAAPVPAASAAASAVPVAAPAPDQGRVVKSGAMALIVDDGKVSSTLTAVQQAALAQDGLVFASSTQESGPTPSGTVTVRVPVDRFEATVLAVRGLDAEVRSVQTKATEVTAQYADLATQIRTLKASRERFLVILQDARDIGAVLAVQQRIDSVSGQVDQLEGRLKVLKDQSEMSTLAVTVTEADDPVVTAQERPQNGLAQAWGDAVDGFSSGVEGLIRGSGRAALALLCLIAAAVVLRLGWRVGRRRAL